MRIGSKNVERDGVPLVMAEIGVNHDGDPAKARELVEAAKWAGADAVKFQLFRGELLLANEAGLVEYQKGSAATASDLLKPLELGVEQMSPLVKLAQGMGMAAVVTPFSPELVQGCVEMGVDAIKLASPDLVNRPLLEAAAETKLAMILSSGAAEMNEVERTAGWLWKFGAQERTTLLHCVSSYPTAPKFATLGGIAAMRARFLEFPIGYSDHTEELFTGGLAVAAGACLLEKHLTLDRSAKGPDHAASLEPEAFKRYVEFARDAFVMRGAMVKKVLDVEKGVREQTRQSVVAKGLLKVGTVLTREMLTVKRPGTGIPAADLERVIGKTVTREVGENCLVHWADVGGES